MESDVVEILAVNQDDCSAYERQAGRPLGDHTCRHGRSSVHHPTSALRDRAEPHASAAHDGESTGVQRQSTGGDGRGHDSGGD